jgi:hypothetical protein
MKKSPNQIRVELKEIAAAHLQVNSFHWGDLQDATSKEVIYPLMNCYYPNGTLNNNRTSLQLVIEVYDLLYKDGSNLNDVESDTLQVIRDIYQVINKSTRWKKIGKVSNSTVTKHKWGTADVVAGHSITINFDLRDVSGVCDLPIQDYDFDQQVTAGACSQVRVINTDLSYDQSVPAGDVLELQDNGYDITNSEGNTIISGSEVAQNDINKVLPDVTHTDSDGSPVVYPSAKAFVCTPSVQKFSQTGLLVKSGESGDTQGRDGDVLTLGAPILDKDGNDFLNNNTDRLVDTNGGTSFSNGIVVDRSTFDTETGRVLCYYLVYPTTNDFFTATTQAAGTTVGGFSGWLLSSRKEQNNLLHDGVHGYLNYPPFNISPIGTKFFFTRTEFPGNTSLVYLTRESSIDSAISKITVRTDCYLLMTKILTWNGTILT